MMEGGVLAALGVGLFPLDWEMLATLVVPRHQLLYLFFTFSQIKYTAATLTMAELAFAKSFLSALDPKPVKLRADYVLPPEQVDLRGPVRHHTPHTHTPNTTPY
jgi:hypothetical protein